MDGHVFGPGPERGEVWFVRGDRRAAVGTEAWSDRPTVVVSPTGRNASGGFAVVAYVRRGLRPSPMHVETAHGTVLTEQLFTVDASRLSRRIGRLTDDELGRVERAVSITVGLGRTRRNGR